MLLKRTAIRVTAGAAIVIALAVNMVTRRPNASNNAPDRIRPRPLHIERTPTKVVARAAAAPTESDISLAALMTVLPIAAERMQ
jgi:hypothetical protein